MKTSLTFKELFYDRPSDSNNNNNNHNENLSSSTPQERKRSNTAIDFENLTMGRNDILENRDESEVNIELTITFDLSKLFCSSFEHMKA